MGILDSMLSQSEENPMEGHIKHEYVEWIGKQAYLPINEERDRFVKVTIIAFGNWERHHLGTTVKFFNIMTTTSPAWSLVQFPFNLVSNSPDFDYRDEVPAWWQEVQANQPFSMDRSIRVVRFVPIHSLIRPQDLPDGVTVVAGEWDE